MEEQIKQDLIRWGMSRHAFHNRGSNIRPREETTLIEDMEQAMLRVRAWADKLAEDARGTGI